MKTITGGMDRGSLRRRFATILLAVALVVLASGLRIARAQGIYVSTNASGSYGAYGIINPLTGVFTDLYDSNNDPSFIGYYGLAAASPTLLYAADTNAPNALYSVTAATGTPTSLSSLSSGNDVLGLAYANSTLFGINPSNPNKLLTINPATGAATVFETLGFDGDGTIGVGPDGNLYITQGDSGNGLYRVNSATGAVTQVNTGSESSIIGTLFGLGSVNGTLYGFGFDGGIYSIDLTTGAAKSTGATYDVNTYGAVFAATGPAIVAGAAAPEPADILLALPVLATMFLYRRRRNWL